MWAYSAILSLVKFIPHWWDHSKLEILQMKKSQSCPWGAPHRPSSGLLTRGAGWTCSKCIWHNCKGRNFIYSLRSAKSRCLKMFFPEWSFLALHTYVCPIMHYEPVFIQTLTLNYSSNYNYTNITKYLQTVTMVHSRISWVCTKTMPSCALKAPMCSWLYKTYSERLGKRACFWGIRLCRNSA